MKKKIIIIALVFVFLLGFFLYFNFSSQKTPQSLPSTPTPTISINQEGGRGDANYFEYLQKEATDKFPLIDSMPHTESTWSIDYLGPLHLEVTIKNKNTEVVKEEVLAWIKGLNVDPTTHQIDWINKF